MQVASEELKKDASVDIVIGNNHKKDLPELLKQYEMEKSGHTEYAMEDINRTKEYEELHLTKPGDHTRAYIKVQDGCNQFCTYCIILCEGQSAEQADKGRAGRSERSCRKRI